MKPTVFFYDVLKLPNGEEHFLKIRSMVGMIPLFAVETLEPEIVDCPPGIKRSRHGFIDNHPDVPEHIEMTQRSARGVRRLLSLVNRKQLKRVLSRMLDETEFFSPYGVRAVSRFHKDHPYEGHVNGNTNGVDYEPAESSTGLFGGNSNWRGPIWFPVNYLLVESLQKFHHYYGEDFKVECTTHASNEADLWQVAAEISRRLIHIFLRDSNGRRPVAGGTEFFQSDPHWRDLILFYEYFHGDNGSGIGASHQTGWTGLLSKLMGKNEPNLEGYVVDVTDEAAVRQLVEKIVGKYRHLDAMVNTVGGYAGGTKLWELETKVFDQMLALNLRAGYALARAVVRAMLKEGRGAIVNVAAKAAVDHAGGAAAYAGSQSAAAALLDSLAAELKGRRG